MVCAVRICAKRVLELYVYIERDRYVVVIFNPVRAVHGNMNPSAGAQFIRSCAALKLWFVNWRIVINCPKAFDFFFRKDITICAIKDVNSLRSFDLQQKTAFTIDVVGRDTFWRSDEDKSVFA